jgi:hypothetical protein
MAHDVFISHSAKDKTTADAVCAKLEAEGIRCWIAPRDVTPGLEWGAAIIAAIKQARVMVLVFTANANASQQIRREVERAVHHGVAILPFRVENIVPDESLEYFIGNVHWLDALTPPLDAHLKSLARTIKSLLAAPAPPQSESGAAAASGLETGAAQKPASRLAGTGALPRFRLWGVQAWIWAGGALALLLLAVVLVSVRLVSSPPASAPSPSSLPQTGPTPAVKSEPSEPGAATVSEPPHQPKSGRTSTNAPANPSLGTSPQTDELRARQLMQAKRYSEALPFANRACNEGVMNGCNILGMLYGNGFGVAQNYARARSLYQEACNGGEVSGCGNLGYLYVGGLGVPQNVAQGKTLLERACNAGRPWSCSQLQQLQR